MRVAVGIGSTHPKLVGAKEWRWKTEQGGQMKIKQVGTTEETAEIDALCQRNWELFQKIAEIQEELDWMLGKQTPRLELRSHLNRIREQ